MNKGYLVIDDSLFKSLAHTFHYVAESEEENIAKKKITDDNFTKEYQKSGKKRLRKKLEKEDNEEEEKNPRAGTGFISNSVNQRKYKNMIPGFSIIKNSIITPLLIASERVVEYMIPEQKQSNSKDMHDESIEKDEFQKEKEMNDKMSKLTIEDIERRQRKHTMKSLRKSDHDIKISTDLMNKASDWVDYISERMPVESKVTSNFVTNMIELSDSALKRISASCKGIDETHDNINMRFIKPSKKFYNLLMSVWIKLDSTSIFGLTESMFIDNVKQSLETQEIVWSDAYLKPTTTFFNVAKEEFMSMYETQKHESDDLEVEPSNFVFSMNKFFTSIKWTLLQMWNSEIVNKSARFQSASVSKESEDSQPWSDVKEEVKENADCN